MQMATVSRVSRQARLRVRTRSRAARADASSAGSPRTPPLTHPHTVVGTGKRPPVRHEGRTSPTVCPDEHLDFRADDRARSPRSGRASPTPSARRYDGTGVNFALFSEVAERVELVLVDDDGSDDHASS